MKKLIGVLVAVVAMVGIVGVMPSVVSADAVGSAMDGLNAAGGNNDNRTLQGSFQSIVNMLLFLIGAVAVIMIIIGGFKYVTANGDSSAITSAKNTILYSVIGIVVAIMAYAIVNFVLVSFTK